MLTPLVFLTLAAPFPPQLDEPPDDAWTIGRGAGFSSFAYQDDAGVPAASTRLEFRRDDAGYGALVESVPYDRGVYTSLFLPNEGARWCWRMTYINTLGESATSAERCFRTDWTAPSSPAFVDAGAVFSGGNVFIDTLPATDALSGVSGYFLDLAPVASQHFYDYAFPTSPLPVVAWVGEGSWLGWVRVFDRAGNSNAGDFGSYIIPITVSASNAVPVPDAPAFESAMVNAYGSTLVWNDAWMADAGVTHVVSSFCNLDAGCEWRHGFHSAPLREGPRRWLQLGDEGTNVARIAVVQGGNVGPWSQPSSPVLVDRTPPPVPVAFLATPSAARTGPITLTWGPVIDNLTGLDGTIFEETELASGARRKHFAHAPFLTLDVTAPGDGVFQFRAASIDRVGNQSGWTAPVVSVIDSRGPLSIPPVARAQALDGGALVSLTWSLPTDALSGVTSQELREDAIDAGTQVISVTGLSASRLVPPGTWRWSLRATDAVGNVGAFSAPSNVIVVTATRVVIGPSFIAPPLAAHCGELLAVDLSGSGDAPLTWSLVSGPAELVVDSTGHLTWTPLAQSSGVQSAVVRLANGAGSVEGPVDFQVTCPSSSDAGTSPTRRAFAVGCGCASLERSVACLCLLWFSRRRESRRRVAIS